MSNVTNDSLLDETLNLLEIAKEVSEEFTGTTAGGIVDREIAQVLKHIEDKNLEDLFAYSKPALEKTVFELGLQLAEEEV